MLLPKQNIPNDQKELLKLYSGLTEEDRKTLRAFAEFLAGRSQEVESDEAGVGEVKAEPKHIPRPEQETVVGAIKRLSETYYMLDRSELLNETSSLMTAHIIQGRKAPDVINDLETLFAQNYRQHNKP